MPGKQRKNKPDQAGQLEAARIIAADPAKYQGALREWALRFLQKQEPISTIRDHTPAKVPYSGH